ncbi:hypothetical protein SDC9_153702 [bioreactor metagenome]|uniref:Uncharacterized protein n=1 Tax=bioreactor metagenome TaxID=1076179 RepID=A0A645EYE4_9ZZZZ
MVLVLAVLAVEDLGGDHHRGVGVQQGDLHRHHRQVPLGHAHHPGGVDPDRLTGRGAPDDVAAQDTVAEVDGALVLLEVGDRDVDRLVVDVELHHLGVGRVDDRLPDPGEAVRLLGVPDRPGLVEPVDEGAVCEALPALLRVAAHAEVAVADREQRLGAAQVGPVRPGLHQPPLVEREPGPVQRIDRVRRRVGVLR